MNIPFNRASFDGNEVRYLTNAVEGGHVSGGGPLTHRAETILRDLHQADRALLVTSCTHALELSALLLAFEPGDEVIVPSYTFVTTASAFLMHGARPVFVDSRSDTLNVDFDAVEAAITPRTRAICIVHYAGVGAEPDRFASLAEERGLLLIEDNAHGLAGQYQNRTLGTFGALSTLSFHETKNITCGEGGALIVNDPSLAERAEILRDKGTNRAKFLRGQVDKYTWVDVGSSWVLSDLLAGVLLAQLERRESIQQQRAAIWRTYRDELGDWAENTGTLLPIVPDQAEHTAHCFSLRVGDVAERTELINHLAAADIQAVFHYQPLHLSPVGRRLGGRPGQCPVAERTADTLVRLPLYNSLTADQQRTVIERVRTFRA